MVCSRADSSRICGPDVGEVHVVGLPDRAGLEFRVHHGVPANGDRWLSGSLVLPPPIQGQLACLLRHLQTYKVSPRLNGCRLAAHHRV